jgi:hypothetical protein
MILSRLLLAACVAGGSLPAAASCGSAFCAINTQWDTQGMSAEAGRFANAEPDLSGGRFLYASPGASIALGRDAQFYIFFQQPLVRDVNGIQLVARQAVVAGFSKRF